MTTKVVAVDGPGGSGKSTLAHRISGRLRNAPIIHSDDFASADNSLNWWPRMLEQVLLPLSKNLPANYQRYDWNNAELAEWHEVKPQDVVIIEGVSASREVFRPYLSYKIWVETPRTERLRRGLERDGEDARQQWEEWMAEEDKYIVRENPSSHADIVVDGTS